MRLARAASRGVLLFSVCAHWSAEAIGQETINDGTKSDKAVDEGKPGFWHRSFQPIQYFTNLDRDAKRFNFTDQAASAPGASQAALTTYAQAGITLSDSACTGWLQTLAYSERDSNFFKDILNIVGNLILGISGVNGANPSSLAKGSLGLAAGNATIEAYQNEVILGTISDIQAKLEEGRRTSAAYFVQHVPDNYDETKRRLAEYHGLCTPGAVKTLLKTSLSAVKYVAPDTTLGGPIGQMKSDLAVVELSQKLFSSGKGVQLSDDSLYKLYVSTVLMPNSTAAFVEAAKADSFVKSLAKNFKPDDDSQLALLQTIANNRDYVARAQADLKKELDQNAAKEVAAKTSEVAAAATDKANAVAEQTQKKAEVAASREAVAAAIPSIADKAKDPAVSNDDVVKFANKAAQATQDKDDAAKAKAAAANVEKATNALTVVEAKVNAADKTIETAKTALSNALSLQSTLKSSALDTKRRPASSITAVLVPAN